MKTAERGLRFDKVALRVVDRLRTRLARVVPDGMTLIVTITAPIRLPAKTVVAVEDEACAALTRTSPRRDQKATIYGNRVRIRLTTRETTRTPKVIALVHNPDTDPFQFVNAFARKTRRTRPRP